jgi:hypothetical protein
MQAPGSTSPINTSSSTALRAASSDKAVSADVQRQRQPLAAFVSNGRADATADDSHPANAISPSLQNHRIFPHFS